MKKKVLLTGGSGFLGKVLAEQLKDDFEITLLHRSVNLNLEKKFPVIHCDLSQSVIPDQMNIGWDLVLHAAGKSGSSLQKEIDNELFYESNVIGTKNLLKSLDSNPPEQLIYFSSVSVYGIEEGIAVDESSPLRAEDEYGKSKLEAEKIVRDWAIGKDIHNLILRLPLIVGPNPPGNLGKMIEAIKRNRYVSIGGGKAKKSMVWIEDIADFIPKLEDKDGIYNLTDQHHPTFRELENIISEKTGNKILSVPTWLAYFVSIFGSGINTLNLPIKFPLDQNTYKKISKSVTFDDSLAVEELNWAPQKVLRKLKEMKLDW